MCAGGESRRWSGRPWQTPMSSCSGCTEGAERLLELSGFEREARSLSPHITLARVRDGIAPWEQQMLEDWATTQRDFTAIALAVESIALMKSDLKPHRAEYSVCKQFELRGT